MTLTPEMQELREAAKKASSWQWETVQGDQFGHFDEGIFYDIGTVDADQYSINGEELNSEVLKFIAAANPFAILALLASYEALTAENGHAIDSIAQLQEEVLALQARLSTVRKLPNLTNPELMQLGTRTCSVEGEHFLPMKFGRAVINALHDQIEAASVAAQTGTAPAKESALQALVDQAQELDMGYGKVGGNG